MDFIIKTYAILATIPFISFAAIYYLLILLDKPKKIALNWAIILTSFLLFGAVASQVKFLFDKGSGLWFTLIWLIIISLTLSFLQWKKRGAIYYKKILISTTKLGFIIFGFFYILFFFIWFIAK